MAERRSARNEASDSDADAHGSLGRYVLGLGLAVALTLASFWVAGTHAIWMPGIPVLLAVLAIAQMGVHLVFFLNISSGPDQTNNVLALAFGIFVVGLVVFGSMIIMANLNANMLSMPQLLQLQR
jgi:cytochrome o ubiquinol oxidase operon protein cyoD